MQPTSRRYCWDSMKQNVLVLGLVSAASHERKNRPGGPGAKEKRMMRMFLNSKIHRATVVEADLDYEGSFTIDEDLMDAAGIANYESVHVWNVTNGARLTTYAIAGVRGSGMICANGATAHLIGRGQIVIIATFALLTEAEAARHRPRIVLVDGRNRICQRDAREVPGPWSRDPKRTPTLPPQV